VELFGLQFVGALEDNAIATHVAVVVEYLDPETGKLGLRVMGDDDMSMWLRVGMLQAVLSTDLEELVTTF
jgi:hypothetical protein